MMLASSYAEIRYFAQLPFVASRLDILSGHAAEPASIVQTRLLTTTASTTSFYGEAGVPEDNARRDLPLRRWRFVVARASGGGFRGQIVRPGEALYVSFMNPQMHVPPISMADSGSAGTFMFVHSADRSTFIYDGTHTASLVAAAASLHVGARGVAGDFVTSLMLVPPYSVRGVSRIPAFPTDFVRRLDAGEVYVNVTSTRFPEGEIRGQLLRQQP
jgi:hypothetical protein